MKKNLHLLLIFLFTLLLSSKAFAVEYTWTWTGNVDNTWSTTGNWTVTPAGAPSSTYPRNLLGDNAIVIFNGSANVVLNANVAAAFFVQELRITSGNLILTNSSRTTSIGFDGVGLNVQSGTSLTMAGSNRTQLLFNSLNNNCTIGGTVDIAGTGTGTGSSGNGNLFDRVNTSAASRVTVASGGKVIISGINAIMNTWSSVSLIFQSGSTFEIQRDGGTIPSANYNVGSRILVSEGASARVTNPSISTNSFTGDNTVIYNGDIEFNNSAGASGQGGSPNQWSVNSFTMSSVGTITMKKGYLRILGSGISLNPFTIAGIDFPNVAGSATLDLQPSSASANNIVVTNNISMAGTGKIFNLNSHGTNSLNITVNGSLTQSGGTIDFASSGGVGKLLVKGNVTQTSGTLTESGTSTTSGLNFTGTTSQNLTSTGTISGDRFIMTVNNANNHVNQLSNVTLPYRLQCSAGSMILGSTTLTVTEKVLGSRTGGRVVTNLGGTLTLKNVDNVGKDFPVGISTASHDAVWVTNASGTADFTISVGSTLNPIANLNTTNTLPRQWEITSASAGANLEFDPDPTAGTQTMTKSIGRYVTSAWVSTNAVVGVNNGYPYSASFTAFSSFVVGATDVIPVELTAFKAQSKGSSNLVEWATASEINTAYFNLERSADGRNAWQSIGTVKAASNSNRPLAYNFVDQGPLSISYYRLTTVDTDGKKTTSKTISVNTGKGKLALLNIYPLPAKNVVNLDFDATPNTTVAVTLKDMTGRTVLVKNTKITEGSNQLTLEVSGLANGIYILTMNDGISSFVQRIVKQ